MPWTTDEWKGCYPSSWKGMIVPEAMAHPAKFSSKLIRRIYEHMRAEKWVKPGDRVIDPFGGVALGALDAMRLGLEWLGMELEVKFVDMGNHNISNWELKFGKSMPNWGSARLVQGDSRKMLEKLGRGSTVLSSPPYAETDLSYKKNGLKVDGKDKYERPYMDGQSDENYGQPPGQLGAMKDDEEGRAAAMISSPPFGKSLAREGVDADSRRQLAREQGLSNSEHVSPIDMGRIGALNQEYGSTPGQLGGMETGDFDAAISSPPFTESNADGGWQMLDKYAREGKLTVKQAKGDPSKSYPSWAADRDTSYGETDGQLSKMEPGNFAEAMISSPPYTGNVQVEKNSKSVNRERQYEAYKASGGGQSFDAFCATQDKHSQGYGNSDGQLADMGDGDFNAAISSPPFLQSEGGNGAQGGVIDERLMKRHAAGNSAAEGYGGADGQLGNMGVGSFDDAVSSPPYSGDVVRSRGQELEEARMKKKGYKPNGNAGVETMGPYGETKGNIGNDSGSDFWTAARQIVEQVYLALAPGGHAVWVVKNYVKKKEMVPFSDQWRQLCEAVGFETLHEHRALLVHATSFTLDGGEVHKESKSFFRRLAEKKGSPRIDHETVWCMVKPL